MATNFRHALDIGMNLVADAYRLVGEHHKDGK